MSSHLKFNKHSAIICILLTNHGRSIKGGMIVSKGYIIRYAGWVVFLLTSIIFVSQLQDSKSSTEIMAKAKRRKKVSFLKRKRNISWHIEQPLFLYVTFDDGPNFGTETVLDAFKKVKHGYVPFSSYNANYISPSILSSHITKKTNSVWRTLWGSGKHCWKNVILFCCIFKISQIIFIKKY